MSGIWPLRLAYRTGSTLSPRACRCLPHHSPNALLTTTSTVPVRATPSRTPRRTHGRTRSPVPIPEIDLTTIESNIDLVPTRNSVRDPMQPGPIPSCSPLTHVPPHMH